MRFLGILLVTVCCAAMGSVAGAVITGDAGGNFNVFGEASTFVQDMIVDYGASSSYMATLFDAAKGIHYTTTDTTGGPVPNDLGYLYIPFTFAQPLETCRLDYGTVVNDTGSNWGYVQLDITTDVGTVDEVVTKIFFHHSPDTDQSESMNYTPAGGVPNGGNDARIYAYTEIDDLVAGKTSFMLTVTAKRYSPNPRDGGSFLPDREAIGLWPESDFHMTGTMIPEPATMALLALGGAALIRRKR